MRCSALTGLPPAPAGKTGWPWTVASAALPASMPDGRPWPRISVVTPSFNQGQFIEETIRSVLLQGYPNLDYIIVDGGSTDASVDIIRRYIPWISSWSSERDDGQSDAINKGLGAATGVIVSWLNSDDLLTLEALYKVARRFASEDRPAVVCGTAEVRSTDLSAVLWLFNSPPRCAADILAFPEGRHIGQPSVFISRELLDFPEPLRRDLNYVMDFELWLRLAKKREFVTVSDTLSWMRHHDEAKTIRDNYQIYDELELVIAEYADLVSPQRAAAVIQACRQKGARAHVNYALRQTGLHKRLAALSSLLKALKLDRGVLSYQLFYTAMAGIFLPHSPQSRAGTNR